MVRGQTIFLVYSANDWARPSYSVGLLTANLADADNLQDPGVWTKKASGPVFASNPSANVYGPGNMQFFKSPDGTEDWIGYHVKTSTDTRGPRVLQVRRLDWSSDGTPQFGKPIAADSHMSVPSGDPGGSSYEVEQGDLNNVSVLHSAAASARTYVSGITTEESQVRVSVNVPVAGTYPVRVWYANAASGLATQNMGINSGTPLMVPYPPTGTSGHFPMQRYTTVSATFRAGWNSITFTRGSGAVELDRLQVDVGRTSDGAGAVAPADDAVETFVVDGAQRVRSRSYTDAGGWEAWLTPGHQPAVGLIGVPAATSRNGRVELVATGRDGNLWATWRDSAAATWQPWASIGRPPAGIAPLGATVTSKSSTSFDVFVLGADREIWQRTWTDGSGWSPWSPTQPAPGVRFVTPPAVVSKAAGTLNLYGVASDGLVYSTFWNGEGWSSWATLAAPDGESATSAPAVTSNNSWHLQVFVRGNDGQIWTRRWVLGWGEWSRVSASGGPEMFSSAAGAAARTGTNTIDLFARNSSSVFTSRFADTWTPWTSLGSP